MQVVLITFKQLKTQKLVVFQKAVFHQAYFIYTF